MGEDLTPSDPRDFSVEKKKNQGIFTHFKILQDLNENLSIVQIMKAPWGLGSFPYRKELGGWSLY